MMASGVGFMCKIKGNMDANLYVQILDDELLQFLEHHDLDPHNVIFQQDNDRKYKSKRAERRFLEHRMEVMEWPA